MNIINEYPLVTNTGIFCIFDTLMLMRWVRIS